MNNDDEWLTLHEAAKRLKIHYVTMVKWRKQGKIKSYTLGEKGFRVKKSDVDALIMRGETDASAG